MRNAPPRLERISDYVDYYAATTPSAPAASLDGEVVTYSELKSRVDACALALIACGVEKGDRVATLSPPCPDFLVVFLATATVGGIWLGLNPRYKFLEYAYVVGDAKPKVLFARTNIDGRDYRRDVAALSEDAEYLTSLVVLSDGPEPTCDHLNYGRFIAKGDSISMESLMKRREQTSGTDAALLVYTSGTTGRPKGALLPHRGLVTCCEVQSHHWKAEPTRILNFLPINHVGCVGDISSFILMNGGCNVFMEKFDPGKSLEMIEKERVTIWGGIPTTIQMCLEHPDSDQYDLSSIQLIAWSGAAASRSLIERMRKITPNLSVSYGLTESVGSVTYAQVGASSDVLSSTIGIPASAFEFRIMTPEGREAIAGEMGEIQLRGDFLMLGYFNRPDETSAAIDKEGWLHTGDLGKMRADGNVELAGRMKEMFKSGGYNVYPREIEMVLEEHPGTAMAAVLGVEDHLYGEVGHAFIVPAPGQDYSTEEISLYCRERLANYKVPKGFTVESSLPLLPIGKIDKSALRARLSTLESQAVDS